MSSSSRRSARHFIRSRPRHPPDPKMGRGRTGAGSRTSNGLWSARSLSRNRHMRLSMAIVEQCVPAATPAFRSSSETRSNPLATKRKLRRSRQLGRMATDRPSRRRPLLARRRGGPVPGSRATSPAPPGSVRRDGSRSETPVTAGSLRRRRAPRAGHRPGRAPRLSSTLPRVARVEAGPRLEGGSPPATPPRAANRRRPTVPGDARGRSAPPPAPAPGGRPPHRDGTRRRTTHAATGRPRRADRGAPPGR